MSYIGFIINQVIIIRDIGFLYKLYNWSSISVNLRENCKESILETGKLNRLVPYGDNPIVFPAPNGP